MKKIHIVSLTRENFVIKTTIALKQLSAVVLTHVYIQAFAFMARKHTTIIVITTSNA